MNQKYIRRMEKQGIIESAKQIIDMVNNPHDLDEEIRIKTALKRAYELVEYFKAEKKDLN